MKKKKLNGLSLNKKKVSELNSVVKDMLKGGQQGYPSACCGGGGGGTGACGSLCAFTCSCSLTPNGTCPPFC